MTVFSTTLKRILKQPASWALLLLFPIILTILISISSGSSGSNDAVDVNMYFGVVDQDNTVLSQTLVRQLGMRYSIIELDEKDISSTLTEQDVPWVLLISEGYEDNLLSEYEPVLEGYSLSISDVSALGSVTAANITKALILLGTNDTQAISVWEETAHVDVTILDKDDDWEQIVFWFGFFGFISIFTAYFIVKTLLDDKRGGMPDRLGVLPMKPRKYLILGTLSAFTATEITVALIMFILQVQLGTIPNILHLFGLLSLYNLFSVTMVLAIVSIAKDLGAASVAMTMLSTCFAMLGGLFWPLDFVPEFMRKLAWFSPGYWLSRGLNNIREITFEGYFMPMLLLLGFTLVTMLLGGGKRVQAIED